MDTDGFCSNSHFSFFEVTVDVTLKGAVRWTQVVEVIFQYISMLLTVGPVEWIYDELRQLADLDYGQLNDSITVLKHGVLR